MDNLLSHPLFQHPATIPLAAAILALLIGWWLRGYRNRRHERDVMHECEIRVTAAEEETQRVKDAAQKHAASLAMLRTQHENASTRLVTLESESAEHEDKDEQLSGQLHDWRDRFNEAQVTVELRDTAIADLQSTVDELRTLNSTLGDRVEQQDSDLATLSHDREDWKSKAEHYRRTAHDQTNDLATAEEKLAVAREGLALKETDIASRDSTLNLLQGQYDKLGNEANHLRQALDDRDQLVVDLQEELDQLQAAGSSQTQQAADPTPSATAPAQQDSRLAELEKAQEHWAAEREALLEKVDQQVTKIAQLRAAPNGDQPPVAAPSRLFQSPPSQADDLKQIKGIGKVLETTLHGLGIYQFNQLAQFSNTDLRWLDQQLGTFKGRAKRDNWVAQASELRR